MNDQTYNSFSEGIKKDDFYPEFICDKCDYQFYADYTMHRKAGGQWCLCNKCSNLLLVHFEGAQIFNMYNLDTTQFSWKEIIDIILENVKPCECGGKFEIQYIAKCPKCFQELSDFSLAYIAIQKIKEKAFRDTIDYVSYESELKNLCNQNNRYYHYGFELAVKYFYQQKLNKWSEVQKKQYQREAFPLITTKVYLADQWLIEKRKGKYWKIFSQKASSSLPKDKSLTKKE